MEEVKYLKENGIAVTKDRIVKKFRFRCFVGDAPALALASGTMGHTSYFGCPKCDQVCCNELAGFKAVEYRQMLLYTLPVLLKYAVDPALYHHFLKLHVAVRLLSDPSKYRDYISAAQLLLDQFVQFDSIIGKTNFTFYTHVLMHIPKCVEDYGSLYSWSAYKFENHNRIISCLLRRKHGHIQQFFNRIEELRYAQELEADEEERKKSKFDEFNLKANSIRGGCCMVEPGCPLVITNAFVRNGQEYVSGHQHLKCEDFYDDPLPSMENLGKLLASEILAMAYYL